MDKLIRYIKRCRRLGFHDDEIRSQLNRGYDKKIVSDAFRSVDFHLKKYLEIGTLSLVLILMVLGLFINTANLTGMAIKENMTYHSDYLALTIKNTSSYTWTPKHDGSLTSLSLTGKIIGNGTVKVYLKTENNQTFLIIDNQKEKEKGLSTITGHAIESLSIIGDIKDSTDENDENEDKTTIDNPIIINESLIEHNNTENMDIPSLNESNTSIIILTDNTNIIDDDPHLNLSENSSTDIDISDNPSNNLTTNNITNDNENGSIDNNNITKNSEQTMIIHPDEPQQDLPDNKEISKDNDTINITPDNLSKNTTEDQINNTIDQTISLDFKRLCISSCSLPDIKQDSYQLVFIIEDTELMLEFVDYIIKTPAIIPYDEINITKSTININNPNSTDKGDIISTEDKKTIDIIGHLAYQNKTLVNTRADLQFYIYSNESDILPIWEEIHKNHPIIEGKYNISLGSINILQLDPNTSYYLGTSVDSDSEMKPRIQFKIP